MIKPQKGDFRESLLPSLPAAGIFQSLYTAIAMHRDSAVLLKGKKATAE